MKSVIVLLSTFNGEKYLDEQLKSIIDQKDIKVDILVRDDGSTDQTRTILDKWQDKGLLRWYSGKNIGFAMSFMDLIQNSKDYPYYAFCDQDDIWLPDKLKRAFDILEAIEHPIKLYCSNAYYYKNGEIMGVIHKSVPYYDKHTCLLRNIAPGCSMVFSKSLRDIIAKVSAPHITAHDFWIFQVACLLGKVHYDFKPGLLYRQHENNQIGSKKTFIEVWQRRIRNLTSKRKRHEREEYAGELIKYYDNMMNDDVRNIVLNVSEYRKSIKRRAKLLLDSRYKMDTCVSTFYLKLRIIFSIL